MAAVRHGDAAGWQHSAWIGGPRARIVHVTGRLLRHDPVAAAVFVIGSGRSAGADQLVTMFAQAGVLLAQWRTSDAAVLPLLTEYLHHRVAEIRYRAVFLFGCLGREAARHADQIAELARDEGMRHAVGDAAVWALARQHDSRCLPGLVERLTGDRLGFDNRSGHYPRDTIAFLFRQPGMAETIATLREYATDLVAAVAARIVGRGDPVLVSELCDVLAGWGAAASPAVPIVVPLLDGDTWPAAARALGGIGPVAAPAADLLRQRALQGAGQPVGAWAYWRVTGDAQPAVDILARALDDEVDHQVLRYLADLGPLAAPAADPLRRLATSRHDGMRVEAAHALWKVSQDPPAAAVLTEAIRPLLCGDCTPTPVMRTALRYLSEIGAPAARLALPIALSIIDNPRRLAYFGSWRTFIEDEELRASVTRLTECSA